MRKLDQTVPTKTRFGTIPATHESHTFAFIDSAVNPHIDSHITKAVEVDGAIQLLDDTISTCNISGKDFDALGDNPSRQDIYNKHIEVLERTAREQMDTVAAQERILKEQIAAAQAHLDALKASRG